MTQQAIVHIALVVRDYDEAIAFYCGKLGFDLIEDMAQPAQNKRWVVVAPRGWRETGQGTTVLLARASAPQQQLFVGNQAGGRVFLFLRTDDFDRDFARLVENGVVIIRQPQQQEYGKVAVFADLYGNLWDLVQFAAGHQMTDQKPA